MINICTQPQMFYPIVEQGLTNRKPHVLGVHDTYIYKDMYKYLAKYYAHTRPL